MKAPIYVHEIGAVARTRDERHDSARTNGVRAFVRGRNLIGDAMPDKRARGIVRWSMDVHVDQNGIIWT